MRVLVINPPAYEGREYIREGRCMQTRSSWAALWMPLSLAYIAAWLRDDGHKVLLMDCVALKYDIDDVRRIAGEFGPRLAVVNTAFPSLRGDMDTARAIRESAGGVMTVAIGMCGTLLGREMIEEYPMLDALIVGEPEWAVRALARETEAGRGPSSVQGLIYRGPGGIVENPAQDISSHDLAELPIPARDLLDNEAYTLPSSGEKFTLLSVARGCPYECTYCIANVYYGKKFRKRPVQSVIAEIEDCTIRFGIRNFLFWGESFTLDPAYGEEIADAIIETGLSITWFTTSRADTLTPRLLGKMKRAGCALLGLGIESTDQGVLDRARKGTSVERIREAVRMAHEAGVPVMGHFVFGLPGDGEESAGRSIEFALSSGIEYAQFYSAVPYPKTEFGELARLNGWIDPARRSDFDLADSICRNEELSPARINALRDSAYRRFYLRPRMLWRALRGLKSPRAFFNLVGFRDWMRPAGRGRS